MKKNEKIKLRGMSIDDLNKRLVELSLEVMGTAGKPDRFTGGLVEDTMKLCNTKKQIATLKSILRERLYETD